MAFTGNEGAAIPLEEARQMMDAHEQQCGPDERRSHFFGRVLLDEVLALEDCVGLRIFHALKEGQRELVIIGEDRNGELMLPNDGEIKTQAIDKPGIRQVVDMSKACPPDCN